MTKVASARGAMHQELQEWLRFVISQSHVLAEYPQLLFQQAANHADRSIITIKAEERWESGREGRPWLEWVNKPQHHDPCVMTLAYRYGDSVPCAYSPDGRGIVAGSGWRMLTVWDATPEKKSPPKDWQEANRKSLGACAYSPDGRRIVSGGGRSSNIINDPQNTFGELNILDPETLEEITTLVGHQDLVAACAYSPDGRRIVSGSFDTTLKVWDAATCEEIMMLVGHDDWVVACVYSPDGQQIISASKDRASSDKTLRIWDALSGAEWAVLLGHTHWVTDCAFSPDGTRIVSASSDKTLKLWETSSGAELATLRGHTDRATDCAFSPDGARIVSASADTTLKLWDASSGADLAALRGHTDKVIECAFSFDGTRVVSASFDKTLKLWNAKSGAELGLLSLDEVAKLDKVVISCFASIRSSSTIEIDTDLFEMTQLRETNREPLRR